MLHFDAGHLGLKSFIALITGFWKNTDHDFFSNSLFLSPSGGCSI